MAIQATPCPALFLVRRLIPNEYMARANRKCKHKEIPGGDHGLDNVVDVRREEIQNWLSEIGINGA
jgi:hypothetical protein